MSDHSAEEWRAIPGFSGYEASSAGRIRSWRRNAGSKRPLDEPRILDAKRGSNGYIRANVVSDAGVKTGQSVHRLVATAWYGPCPHGMMCCHNNGNPSDNRAENLRWGSAKSNQADRVAHRTFLCGDRSPVKKLTSLDVAQIRAHRGFVDAASLAEVFGVSDCTISNVWSEKVWSSCSASAQLGTTYKGERAGRATISNDDALKVIGLLSQGTPPHEIVLITGIKKHIVIDIKRRKTWSHLWLYGHLSNVDHV